MAMQVGESGGDEDTPMSDINTTPLVDVMLVLLIIFLITVPSCCNRFRSGCRRCDISRPRPSRRTSTSRSGRGRAGTARSIGT